MAYIITIQYPYQYVEINIAQNATLIESAQISKIQAINLIIPTIANILNNQNITLSEIACIGINTGPGPFNTLRSIIATANGISFTKQIPLVACNGLELLLQENKEVQHQVAILDAFGMDVYFAIQTSGQQGYSSITHLIETLNNLYQGQTITFIGNGAIKHQEYIVQYFSGTACINENILFASTASIINETYHKFSQGQTEKEIFPLYFQSPVIKPN